MGYFTEFEVTENECVIRRRSHTSITYSLSFSNLTASLILSFFANFRFGGLFCIFWYVHDVVVKNSCSLSHLVMSFLFS